MKKIFVLLFFVQIITCSVSAQNFFVPFNPIQTQQQTSSSYDSYNTQQSNPEPNYQIVQGYFINSRGSWEKISLKVTVVESRYGLSCYVKGYKTLGEQYWHNITSSRADAVSRIDEDIIRENFEWKCFIAGASFRYVYF